MIARVPTIRTTRIIAIGRFTTKPSQGTKSSRCGGRSADAWCVLAIHFAGEVEPGVTCSADGGGADYGVYEEREMSQELPTRR